MSESLQIETDLDGYGTCSIKRRRTSSEIQQIKDAIYGICSEGKHAHTVRAIFYQLVKRGLIEKTEKAYAKDVSRLCGLMREEGDLPWSWIVDATRLQRCPRTYESLGSFVEENAHLYRRDLWRSQNKYVEIWCEKATIQLQLTEVTYEWAVPLMCTTGFSSKGFIHAAAEDIVERDCPSFIYYLGDHDPSGLKIWEAIQNSFVRYYYNISCDKGRDEERTSECWLRFEKLAVEPWQIDHYKLPTRPTKTDSSHAKDWDGSESVELDAMPIDVLQDLVRGAIEQHVDKRQLAVLQVAEKSEREMLSMWKPKGKRR